jgi:hypothetical protein
MHLLSFHSLVYEYPSGIVSLAKASRAVCKIGSRVTSTSIVKYREKKTLSIPIPNAVAMCLKVSSSAHKSAYECTLSLMNSY